MKLNPIKILAVFALMTLPNFINAQSFEVGIQTGYGIANITSEEATSGTRGVYHIGLVTQYNFNDNWSVVAKVHKDQKGYKYNDGTVGRETMNYIDIPVMAKWHFGNKVRGYVQAGVYFGIFQSAEGELNAGRIHPHTGNVAQSNMTIDTSSAYNKDDFGLNAGVGAEMKIIDQLKGFIELELTPGLADISKANHTFRNGASKIGIGVRYQFGKNKE